MDTGINEAWVSSLNRKVSVKRIKFDDYMPWLIKFGYVQQRTNLSGAIDSLRSLGVDEATILRLIRDSL